MTASSITQQASPDPVRPPKLTPLAAVRWMWRSLTSMRTALMLLFLWAIAAIPGSVFPQRGVAPIRVQQFLTDHTALGPWLDRFSLFDVYAAPWFAAIYLLLMVSLVGCVVPRCIQYARMVVAQPPPAPRNLLRLPVSRVSTSQRLPVDVITVAATSLGSANFRVRRAPDNSWIAAEKGYLHEAGNLLFHGALMVMLVGVLVGSLFGYRGTVVVVEGGGFSNTRTQYDDFSSGRSVEPSALQPFSLMLDSFTATYVREGPRFGQPASFRANVTYQDEPGAAARPATIEVNSPLEINGTTVFLLGSGYAPRFTVRNPRGDIVFQNVIPSLPQDPAFTSKTVVKVPDTQPDQLGFNVTVVPTAPKLVDPTMGPRSVFPDDDSPRAYLGAWAGDLGLDTGVPQSVYELDTTNMTSIGLRALDVGETWQLPDDRGSITFDGLSEFANFQIAHSPGSPITLIGAIAAIIGVSTSLYVRRRRIWVRVTEQDGQTEIIVAGLARTEFPGLVSEVDRVLRALEDDRSMSGANS